ncbi:MAG TPA: PA2169 family four-helix-bundle protein [Prosthecobacter sp.]
MNSDKQHRPASRPDGNGLDETQPIPPHLLPPQADPESQGMLENLVKVTRDGEQGFQYAAQHVHDRGLRDEFQKFARERRSMMAELTPWVNIFQGRMAEQSGTPVAAIHRTWMGLRTVLSEEPDDQSILDEVERGEDAAEAAYLHALQDPSFLPPPARQAVLTLAQKVQRAHQRVRSLRDSGVYKHASR